MHSHGCSSFISLLVNREVPLVPASACVLIQVTLDVAGDPFGMAVDEDLIAAHIVGVSGLAAKGGAETVQAIVDDTCEAIPDLDALSHAVNLGEGHNVGANVAAGEVLVGIDLS